jgi:hypothetical protein
MTGFNGYASSHLYRGARGKSGGFQGKEIIAKIFAGVGNHWGAGGRVEKLHSEHELNGKGAASVVSSTCRDFLYFGRTYLFLPQGDI